MTAADMRKTAVDAKRARLLYDRIMSCARNGDSQVAICRESTDHIADGLDELLRMLLTDFRKNGFSADRSNHEYIAISREFSLAETAFNQ